MVPKYALHVTISMEQLEDVANYIHNESKGTVECMIVLNKEGDNDIYFATSYESKELNGLNNIVSTFETQIQQKEDIPIVLYSSEHITLKNAKHGFVPNFGMIIFPEIGKIKRGTTLIFAGMVTVGKLKLYVKDAFLDRFPEVIIA